MPLCDKTLAGTDSEKNRKIRQALGNIATTHVLFSVLTPEIVDQIIKMQYVLVIDEAIGCVGLLDNELKKSDTLALLKSNMVFVDDENRGRLTWNEEDYPEHDGKYSKIRSMCKMSMLYCYADTFLMFEYPPKLLKELEQVFVLTYLFDGSDMRCIVTGKQIGRAHV